MTVNLQLQWAPPAQFAGYFAADREGYYAEQGLERQLPARRSGHRAADGRIRPAVPSSRSRGCRKVLEVRAKGQSDLVDIAQVFQRAGTRSVSWAAGKGPAPVTHEALLG